jgi:predicted RNA-binding protein with RPS1 domain
MLKVGDVVDAEVTNVQVFGIFCRHGQEDMLVVIPETSWIASFCSCNQFAQPGDTLKVKVLHIDTGSGRIAATIKGRHSDPWETDQLNVGCRYDALVIRHVDKSDRCSDQPACLLELLPGAFTMLCDATKTLRRGDYAAVMITSSNPGKRAVQITLVNES